jgi:hypothetical protein
MKTLLQTGATIGLALFLNVTLVGCGAGLQVSVDRCLENTCLETNPSRGNTGSSTGNGTGSGTTGPGSTEWDSLNIDGAINGGVFDKTSVISLDKTTKELVVRLPMTTNPYLDGASIALPVDKIEGSRLTLEPLKTGGSTLALRIPLTHILRGVSFLPAQKLPNGDPLPSIPDGELPSTAVQLTKAHDIKATLYLAPTIVGIFVNTPFDPYIRLTLPIRDKARTRTFGYFTTIPAKANGAEGGFFLSIALPSDLVRIIDDNL